MMQRSEHPLGRLRREFDTLFNRLWGGMLTPFEADIEPMRFWDFDMNESPDALNVRAEIPGFEPEELDIQINDNVLTIRAEKRQQEEGTQEYRRFFRSVTLPAGVSTEKVDATYRNGVLELRIPRSEESRARRISVKGDGGQEKQISGAATSQAAGKQSDSAQATKSKEP
jgi:HSP20 family protein